MFLEMIPSANSTRFFQSYTSTEVVYLVLLVGALAIYETCETSGYMATEVLVFNSDNLNWTHYQLAIYRMLTLWCQGERRYSCLNSKTRLDY